MVIECITSTVGLLPKGCHDKFADCELVHEAPTGCKGSVFEVELDKFVVEELSPIDKVGEPSGIVVG